MTADAILAALALPSQALNALRVPKKTLSEHAANSTADRKLLTEGVEEITWVASLKPTNTGVAAFRDDTREYLEIAVVLAEWKPEARAERLHELIHRAIPYPTLLISANGTLSAAHIRKSASTTAATVLDGEIHYANLSEVDAVSGAFLASLPLAGLPAGDLFALYQSYIDRMTALAVARITGGFSVVSPTVAERKRAVLEELLTLDAEMARTKKLAETVSQMNQQVQLNLKLRSLRTERLRLLDCLSQDATS